MRLFIARLWRDLAKNVIFNSAEASALNGQSAQVVDTETKVLAENVIFEGTESSTIISDNVQGVLEELSLDLSKILVGKWTIVNKNEESDHSPTGAITINSNGTFDLTAGSFAAVGMGSGDGGSFCNHLNSGQTYEFLGTSLVAFTHTNATTVNSVIPTLVNLKQDEITFLGQGGCGTPGYSRVSIFTRVP